MTKKDNQTFSAWKWEFFYKKGHSENFGPRNFFPSSKKSAPGLRLSGGCILA